MGVITISITHEVPIREFKQWLEKETVDILRPLNEQGTKVVDKLRERLSDARETCEKLADESSKEIEKGGAIRKAKVTERLSRYFLKQFDKIIFPDKLSFAELDRLDRDLERTLSYITRERNMWFPRISPLFIIARKRVDFAFGRLAGSVSDLHSFLSSDYSKAHVVEKLFSEFDEIERLLFDLEGYEKRKMSTTERMYLLQKKVEETEQRIESTRNSAELGDLAEINVKNQQLRKQVKYAFRHLQKPFMKFANLRDPEFALTSQEVEKLGQYLEDPYIAFATDELEYPTLRSILKKIDLAMERGKLKLKSSRLRKSRGEIDAILNKNALTSLHQECTRAFSLSQQLISSEETQVAQNKIKHLHKRLEELQRREKSIVVRLDAFEKEHLQLLQKVNEQKEKLEKLVHEVLEKRANIRL